MASESEITSYQKVRDITEKKHFTYLTAYFVNFLLLGFFLHVKL